MKRFAAFVCVALFASNALAQVAPVQASAPTFVPAAPPSTQQSNVSTRATTVDETYRLAAGDEIRIAVYGEPDLTTDVRLGPQGDITAPLIGNLNANGMTAPQLQQALADRYRRGLLRNPRVSVTIATYRPYYVIGEVTNPGPYPYEANLSLTRAVATAGGFTEHASRSRVYVRRAGATEEQVEALNSNAALQPGDTVRVGQGFLAGLRDLPIWIFR
jgi:polysaccharide export outer membrane protein